MDFRSDITSPETELRFRSSRTTIQADRHRIGSVATTKFSARTQISVEKIAAAEFFPAFRLRLRFAKENGKNKYGWKQVMI